jgi:hypothetical protein
MGHKKYRTETNCLNCGATVERKFCPECGQENIEVQENFFHLVGHFTADYLHYDSKFLKSLKLLIFKPGFLAKQYLEGKRTSYIHPLRLFFFVTIIMVIMGNLYYQKFQKVITGDRIVITEEDKANATEEEIKKLERDEKKIIKSIASGFEKVSYYLKYISFFLLPVYALCFKLLYWRKKHFYVDHLVFTLYLQSFVYVVLSVLLIIPLFITTQARDWFDTALVCITIMYLIASLRYVYQQSWIKTIAKAILATLFMLLVSVLVVAGFISVALIKLT